LFDSRCYQYDWFDPIAMLIQMTSKTKEQLISQGNLIKQGPALLVLPLQTTNSGVFTKADSVKDPAVFSQWLAILAGEDTEHRLAHGYFVTMQQAAIGSTWKNKAEMEEYFFRSGHWMNIDESLKSRLGTYQLRKKLSIELSRLIQQRYLPTQQANCSIPELLRDVEKCRVGVDSEIQLLPQPSTESPTIRMLHLCNQFFHDVEKFIKGDEIEKHDLKVAIGNCDRRFLQAIKGAIAQFGLADQRERHRGVLTDSANDFLFKNHGIYYFVSLMVGTKVSVESPQVDTTTPRTPQSNRRRRISDSDDDVMVIDRPTPRSRVTAKGSPGSFRRSSPGGYQSPMKRKRVEPLTPTSFSDTELPEHNPLTIVYTGLSLYFSAEIGPVIELDEIRAMMRRENARTPYSIASARMHQTLTARATSSWEACAFKYVKEVRYEVETLLHRKCMEVFGPYKDNGLFDVVWYFLDIH
jgi:hypothetical protein